MAARDLGALLRCLGWNPSERELEEVKHELLVSCKYKSHTMALFKDLTLNLTEH